MAAFRMAEALAAAAESLAINPERGRPTRTRTLREYVAIWPYIIRYRISTEAVEIVRIKHGAQRPE